MKKFKILYIISALNSKAPNKLALNLADFMVNKGHDVSVAYFDKQIHVNLNDSIDYININLSQSLNFNEYDIVHSHMFKADIYSSINKPFITDTKFVTTFHCYIYPELLNYYGKIMSIFYSFIWILLSFRFDMIVALTNHMNEYYRKFFLRKLFTIYNGIDIKYSDAVNHQIKEFIGDKDNYLVIGTYCNLIERKNIELLLELINRNVKYKLVVIGDGPNYRKLKNIIFKFKINERVLMTGYLEDSYQYNKYFDVYAMPSKDEAFGLSIIEAALCQKKIVCSDIPAFREILDSKSACFFDPNSVTSLEIALNNILKKTQSSDNAYKIASTLYSNKIMCQNYENLYYSLTKGMK